MPATSHSQTKTYKQDKTEIYKQDKTKTYKQDKHKDIDERQTKIKTITRDRMKSTLILGSR